MSHPETTPVEICCWANAKAAGSAAPVFVVDKLERPLDELSGCHVVMPIGSLDRGRLLLSHDFPTVFIGAAALADASIIDTLAKEFGSERLGVFVRTQRMKVSWAIDRVSNADFKFVAPSICEPCWEILDGQGAPTGTLARWWLQEMAKRGAGKFLVHTAIDDDHDLNICATLIEQLGDQTLISLAEGDTCPLQALVDLAGVRRFVLSPRRFNGDAEVIAMRESAPTSAPPIDELAKEGAVA